MRDLIHETRLIHETHELMCDYILQNPDKEFHFGRTWNGYYTVEFTKDNGNEVAYFPRDNYLTRYSKTGH